MKVYGKGNRGAADSLRRYYPDQVPEAAHTAGLREGVISAGTKPQHPCGTGEGNRAALRSQGAGAESHRAGEWPARAIGVSGEP
jgi:hypothetical protein